MKALSVTLMVVLAVSQPASPRPQRGDNLREPAGRAGVAPAATQKVDTAASSPSTAAASQPASGDGMSAETFAGMTLRCIGPALMEGRIVDIAVHPRDLRQWYIAAGSGGVWKTNNAGVTWAPIFDSQGSYSIGCITIDPKNPYVVWVGTGENNSQRSVSFGDGVYRSRDGGASWENLGLKDSEHIGRIVIDPHDSNVVYVAAQGPLWRAGNDRGLYKTTNGGGTWTRVLHISDDTGVNEVHMDPRDSSVLYASAYQRRRHVWTLIDGGPESAIYKSTDAGATWRKITKGLPESDMGRIGLCVSPVNPDVVYAIIELPENKGGFYRSRDRGESWEKRSDYVSNGPQYYNEIFPDPADADHVYSVDTFLHETRDGGKTFARVPGKDRHVDDHAIWILPDQPAHMLVGCDGGLYETWDGAANWEYKANLPITQFYRVCTDNARPFYNVYGGTQDNNTLGGPSRTLDRIGIGNEHWFVTVGGDGFKSQVDPQDPDTIYSQYQHAGLVRHDRRTGEIVDIKPREAPGEEALRWNWDSPLIISPHDHKRLYFAANRLFRSDDRGNRWTAISGDLTRQIDRNKLEIMGRIQPVDAVARANSTSFYGNIVSLCESPAQAGLIYVGTDDGLIQVTEDGGQTWRKIERFPGVPETTYVSWLAASKHDANTVFAAFDNHKRGDFRPYLFRSPNRGQDWVNIAGDLPARDIVYCMAQDPVDRQLMFAGTEFGVYFTVDGGIKWIRLKGGMPTIAIKDMVIQERENDLVLASFGRGLYILDDYSPLRAMSKERLASDALLLPIKPALRYIAKNRLGGRDGKGTQGASYYAAANPPFGATFTYYLKEKVMSRKERRKEAEKKARKEGGPVKFPSMEELREEDEEKEPVVVMIVRDAADQAIRRLTVSRDKGLHRATWDLRYPSSLPIEISAPAERPPWEDNGPAGSMAPAGTYSVVLAKDVDGVVTPLAGPEKFEVMALESVPAPQDQSPEILAFRRRAADLQRAVQGALRAAQDVERRIKFVRKAILETPTVDTALLAEADRLNQRLLALLVKLRGDPTRGKRNVPTTPSIAERIDDVVGSQWYTTTPPTQTQRDAYRYAGTEFKGVLADLRTLAEKDLAQLEQKLDAAGAPWTPGRIPTWQMEGE